tara:strand:- start:573 stop:1049 length:477 start_codon:yes stop_codon:yes gene_type:complete
LNKSIEVQVACIEKNIPPVENIKRWFCASLLNNIENIEVCIRIVDEPEIQHLNQQYRHKNKPTNVLSFSYLDEFDQDTEVHGDIILCASIIQKEANAQSKSDLAHWAHMLVHGGLHLQGFDHENDTDAEIMEAHEIKILDKLGFNNPYAINNVVNRES